MLSTVPRTQRRSLPARLIFLMLASAMAVLGLLTAAPPASAAAVSVSNATLSWKINNCAFGGQPSCGSLTGAQAVSGNVTKDTDAWIWTAGTGTYDAATGATEVAFTGAIEIGNTVQGNYGFKLENASVTVDSAGNGGVYADVSTRGPASAVWGTASPDVLLVSLGSVPDGTEWTVTPPWEGVGTAGSINGTAPVLGKQYAQPLLDAITNSTLKNWWLDTGTGSTNAHKIPQPVTLNLGTVPQSISGASLTWKINNCAFGGQPSCGSLTGAQAVSGNVTKGTDAWIWTAGTGTYTPSTGETQIDFAGAIEIGNTVQGNYGFKLENASVTVDSAGNGGVYADVSTRGPASAVWGTASPDVLLVSLGSVPDGTEWTVTPPWEGVGTAGSINGTAPVLGKQYAQPLLDAITNSTLKNWWLDTGTGSTNAHKIPQPVTLDLDTTPVDPGPTPPTPPYSGTLGGGSGVPTVDAPATSRPVVSGSLDWGVKAGFHAYITGGVASGTATGANGATPNGDGTFKFPATGGSWDPTTNTGVLNFGGSVQYVGHGGLLDMTVSNPQLHFTSGGSVLYASLSSKSLSSGVMQSYNGAMGTIGGLPSLSGNTLSINGLGVTLSADAAPAFAGFYTAGEGLDALNGADTLGAAGTSSSSTGTTGTTTSGTGTSGTGTSGTGTGNGTSGTGTGTGAGSSSTTPLFTPTGSNTNPPTAIVVSPNVTVVPQRVANSAEVTEVIRPPAVKLTNAPVVRAKVGDVVQLEVSGLPKRTDVDAFIVVNGKRVFLAELTTDKNGDVTLPALLLKKKGVYNIGVELPNGTVRWIKIRIT